MHNEANETHAQLLNLCPTRSINRHENWVVKDAVLSSFLRARCDTELGPWRQRSLTLSLALALALALSHPNILLGQYFFVPMRTMHHDNIRIDPALRHTIRCSRVDSYRVLRADDSTNSEHVSQEARRVSVPELVAC